MNIYVQDMMRRKEDIAVIDKNRCESDSFMRSSSDWLAVRKPRMKANGNYISNSTVSWMWKACQRKE